MANIASICGPHRRRIGSADARLARPKGLILSPWSHKIANTFRRGDVSRS